MIAACDGCLRRGRLLARLAPRIASRLDRRRAGRAGILALSDAELIDAVARRHADVLHATLARFDARTERAALAACGAGAACAHGPAYPDGLAELADPPAVVYWHGRPPRLAPSPAVAVVGSRRPSRYASETARAFGRGLAAAGVTVVSGLALGVDSAAHRGCVEVGGSAIGVLAGGSDVPYPWRHRHLYAHVRSAGTVLSEMPPGQRAFRWSFPARNRIMAGLGAMTLVVEAAERSGSLITADFARDLGRTVGAVPGRIGSRAAAGSNRLLQDGADVITSVEDVLDRLFGVGMRAPRSRPAAPVDAVASAVLDAVERGDGIEDIAAVAGVPAREARAALSRLEVAGLVSRDALGGYVRLPAL